MADSGKPVIIKIVLLTIVLGALLAVSGFLGLSVGSSGNNFAEVWAFIKGAGADDSTVAVIIREIRLPRVILAATVGAVLALGGLVFQALLRNPLAEPYILGVSGGAAIGAIIGMIMRLPQFPGISILAFIGSMATLALVLSLAAGRASLDKDALLLGGVMVNALCGAVIMFLISLSKSTQVKHILFWLMGDLSMISSEGLPILLAVIPCFLVILYFSRSMDLLLLGKDPAAALGVDVQKVSMALLGATSLMVSIVVCQSGLIGFVGLIIPHILRLSLGPDHRVLAPACILGGGAYLILCDLLARTLPPEGEMPVGIITALIGAPLFIFLLWRSKR